MSVGIFSVQNPDITKLDETLAVACFRDLVHSEAIRINIPLNKINISLRTKVPDGGVDGTSENETNIPSNGLIPNGYTAYQIKSNANLKLTTNKGIESIVLDKNKKLPNKVKECLDMKGTYYFVTFQNDFTDEERDKTKSLFINIFENQGYKDSKVEVVGISQLIGFLKYFPSIALSVNNNVSSTPFLTHERWAKNGDMKTPTYEIEDELKVTISSLTNEIIKPTQNAKHIHVFGEAGIGKTRAVLESTKDDLISQLVIYCDKPSKLLETGLIYDLTVQNEYEYILIVDECDDRNARNIWNSLQNQGHRITLITIYNEIPQLPVEVTTFEIPNLQTPSVTSIIKSYGVPDDIASKLAEYCGGAPRVAHVLAQNYSTNAPDLLNPSTVIDLWDRYIAGTDSTTDPMVSKRRTVLLFLSLFKKFGFEKPVSEDSEKILKLIQKYDPSISFATYNEIILRLRKRKVLQGDKVLYISPRALHIYLWRTWWQEIYSSSYPFDFNEFSQLVDNTNLAGWFRDMLVYATESEEAQKVVKNLIDPQKGVIKTFEDLESPFKSKLFRFISDAIPLDAIEALNVLFKDKKKEDLLKYEEGRREIIWALEKIIAQKECFIDGSRILLRLAEAENENIGNNATGVFADLFNPRAKVSELPAIDRLVVLKESLESDSQEQVKTGIKAVEKALNLGSFVQMVGNDFRGFAKTPDYWQAKTWGELSAVYLEVWNLVVKNIDSYSLDNKLDAAKILLNHAIPISHIPSFQTIVLETIEVFFQKGFLTKEQIVQRITSALRHEHISIKNKLNERWNGFLEQVIGDGFSSELERYVGMNLFEDVYGENQHKLNTKIRKLAEYSIKNISELEPEFSWLTTSKAKNGYIFGYELGKLDQKFSLLEEITKKQLELGDSLFFLGGYLKAIDEINEQMVEEYLDNCDPSWIVELSYRTGLKDRKAERITHQILQGVIKPNGLGLFRYGLVVKELSEPIFMKWMNILISESSSSLEISIALDLFEDYYLHQNPEPKIPEEITFKLLTHKSLLQSEGNTGTSMDEYYWKLIAESYISVYPQKAVELGKILIDSFKYDNHIIDEFADSIEILDQIVKAHPVEMWKEISTRLGPPIDSAAFKIKSWLRGKGGDFGGGKFIPGVLVHIPEEVIWQWVDQDVAKRAWYLAYFVPRVFEKDSLARKVLIKYGNSKDVRDHVSFNFSTEGWSGPASIHYQKKKAEFENYMSDESDVLVQKWLNEYIRMLEARIEEEKLREELRDF